LSAVSQYITKILTGSGFHLPENSRKDRARVLQGVCPGLDVPVLAGAAGTLAAASGIGTAVYLAAAYLETDLAAYAWMPAIVRWWVALAVMICLAASIVPDRRSLLVWSTATIGAVILCIWLSLSGGIQPSLSFSHLVRNLNFCGALADLVLWFYLIGRVPINEARVAVCGGLGLQFAGVAMGYALRDVSPSLIVSAAADVFTVGSGVLSLAVWWHCSAASRNHAIGGRIPEARP
jgi:hypothetical protein